MTSSQGDAKIIAFLAARGYVSLNQFARLVGVSYPTALKMRDRGDVKTVPVGGVFRVYNDEIQRFLEKGNNSGESLGSPHSPST